MVLALLVLGSGCGEEPAPASEVIAEPAELAPTAEPATDPPEVARPYEDGVDAQAEVEGAVARASASPSRYSSLRTLLPP